MYTRQRCTIGDRRFGGVKPYDIMTLFICFVSLFLDPAFHLSDPYLPALFSGFTFRNLSDTGCDVGA